MVSYDDLFSICSKYSAQKYYVGDVIPEKKLANARKRYLISRQERVVALVDTTVFGSAKAGLAIGETGLYWRNNNIETKRTYISWLRLAEASIVARGLMSSRVELGKDAVIELSGTDLSKNDVVRLLTDIQHLVRAPSSATSISSSVTYTNEQWLLAVNGRQYGPYDLATVRTMATEGRIDPRECLAWREGMPNWEQFTRVPALAAVLRNTPRPQMSPPPLPVSASPAPRGSQAKAEKVELPSYHGYSSSVMRPAAQINLNRASVDELLSLPGITQLNGHRLIRERERRGGFDTVEAVGHFLGFQPHQLERLRERVSVESYGASRPSTGRVVDF